MGGFTGRLLPKGVGFFFAFPACERIDLFLRYEKKDQFLFLVFEKGTVASQISRLTLFCLGWGAGWGAHCARADFNQL